MVSKKGISQAIQQMIGFRIGKWSANPIELISSMGLTRKEWEHIKKYEESGNIDTKDIIEIDNHFNDLNK